MIEYDNTREVYFNGEVYIYDCSGNLIAIHHEDGVVEQFE